MPVPALAASGPKPADYAAQAGKAADYINGHSADLTKGDLGPELDGALALISAGKTDAKLFGMIKKDIKAKGPSYCTFKNVGGCAKVTITLLAAGEPTTYGGVDYAKPVTSLPDSALKERPFHQALDMIALERLGKPIPQKLFKSITDYVSARPGRNYPSTDGLMLAACRMWCLQHTVRRGLRLSRRRLSNGWMPIVRQMGGVGQATVRMCVRRREWHRVCIGPVTRTTKTRLSRVRRGWPVSRRLTARSQVMSLVPRGR